MAESLRSPATRIATLDALEALARPIPSAVVLAAAPALVDVIATETEWASYGRCGLLLGRLLEEAAPDPAAVYGAAFAGERFAASTASALLVEAVQRASSGQPLTREDARSYTCVQANVGPAYVRGVAVLCVPAGRTVMELIGIVSFSVFASRPCFLALTPVAVSVAQLMSADPIYSQNKMPGDDVPRQMLTLLVDLLRSGELPELAIGGAWWRRAVPHGPPRPGSRGDGARLD